MRLQSRFQNDRRFNLDSRFLDADADNEGDEFYNEEYEQQNGHENYGQQEEEVDERQWQYNILESVMGKKMGQGPQAPSRDAKKK